MAVTHGSAADAYLNGHDVGNYFNQVKSKHQRNILESTVLNSAGVKTYAGGDLKSGNVDASGYFDQITVDGAIITSDVDYGDSMLSTAIENQSTTKDDFLFFPGGAVTLGDRGIGFEGFVNNYEVDTTEGQLGTASMQMEGCTGREPVLLLAPLASRTNAFTGSSINNTAATAAGAAGYVMCTLRTSGTIPILIEHSVDNSAWTTLMTFTNIVASHKWERIETTGTVKQYVRASANGAFVGTFIVALNRK